jgi:hypothetical protein
MALAGNIDEKIQLPGGRLLIFGTLSFDSAYVTGGESIDGLIKDTDLDDAGVEFIRHIIVQTAGYHLRLDQGGEKLLAYYFDYDAAADGAAIQVPNGTDLSGIANAPFVAIA